MKNSERAKLADDPLLVFQTIKHGDSKDRPTDPEQISEDIRDLITDLCHLLMRDGKKDMHVAVSEAHMALDMFMSEVEEPDEEEDDEADPDRG